MVGGQSLLASISIHAPREGGDGQIPLQTQHEIQFQSTPPVRGATTHHGLIHCVRRISIHAPRVGGDDRVPVLPHIGPVISIHAPRKGGDVVALLFFLSCCVFQSTPPARGATLHDHVAGAVRHISIHAPRTGGDHRTGRHLRQLHPISIHAPRKGGDLVGVMLAPRVMRFQSTPPARGATAKMHSFTCGSLTNK